MKRIISALLSILLALAAMTSASVPAQACGDQSNEGASKKGHYEVIEAYPRLYSVEENHFTPAEISAESVSTIYVNSKPCYSINDIAKIAGTTDPDLWYLADWQRFWPDSNYALSLHMEFTSGVIAELNDKELRFLDAEGSIYEPDMGSPCFIEQDGEYFCDIDTALVLFPADTIDGTLSILEKHGASLSFFDGSNADNSYMQRIEHAAWMVWCRSPEDYAGIEQTGLVNIATHEESAAIADFGNEYFTAAYADYTDNSIHINEHYLYGASDIALAGTLAHEGTHITRMDAYDDYSEDYTVLADVRTLTRIGASERLIRDRLDTAAAIPIYNAGFHIAVDWYAAEVGGLYLVA